MNEATSIWEDMAISFNVRKLLIDFRLFQSSHFLRSREALAASGITLEDICLLIKFAHTFNDGFLIDSTINLAKIPASMVLKLWIGIVQEVTPQIPSSIKSIFENRMYVSKQVSLVIRKVHAFI